MICAERRRPSGPTAAAVLLLVIALLVAEDAPGARAASRPAPAAAPSSRPAAASSSPSSSPSATTTTTTATASPASSPASSSFRSSSSAARAATVRAASSAGAQRAAIAASGDAEPLPTDPDFDVIEAEAQLAVQDWSGFADSIPRLLANLKPAIARGKELAALPIPPKPTDPIVGDCVPFRPPAPYKTLQEYIGAFAKMDWRVVEKMFREAKTYKEGLGVRGCCAGAVAGNSAWAQAGIALGRADDFWSGKCIDEDADGVPFALSNAIMPFQIRRRDWARQRVPGDKMAVASVALGKSFLDGQPAWVFDYSKSDFIWGYDFRGIRDELRVVEKGFGIGAVYALASNDTYTSAFNPYNVTGTLIYFVVFQTCASDGNYPTQPIDRVYI